MKKLIIATMIFPATSLYATQGPTPPVYCECMGRGIPVNTDEQLPVQPTPKAAHLGFGAHTFYEFELWAMLFARGV